MKYEKDYFINTGYFLKKKRRFDWLQRKCLREVKFVKLNERVIEIPFVISALSSLPEGAKVLDFGCTESLVPQALSSLGLHVTGIDLRDYPYEAQNFEFHKVDFFKNKFKSDSFDGVSCISAIEHVGLSYYGEEEAKNNDFSAIKEFHRILKPGGIMGLTVPYGIAYEDKFLRVYDEKRLSELTSVFEIQKIKYFCNQPSLKYLSNYWKEISKEEAAKIEFSEWVDCVCCVKLVKIN